MSLDNARTIAREGFSPQESVRVAEHLSAERARAPDESHGVVILAVPWNFRLKDYPRDDLTGDYIVPARVLNLFERAVWSA
jgi:hypothetical protein